MTNSMHRQGSVESLSHDFVIFTTTVGKLNKEGSGPKKREFSLICLKYEPVNFGTDHFVEERANVVAELMRQRKEPRYFTPDGRPTKELLDKWRQKAEACTDSSGPHVVFDSLDKLAAAVQDLKEADLGISINITGLHDRIDCVLREAGITRHSIEHSLGFHGNTARLPAPEILEISTMCGHGMVSFNLVKRMLDLVKQGRLTPLRAAEYLTKPCTCAVFNTVRAAELLDQAKDRI